MKSIITGKIQRTDVDIEDGGSAVICHVTEKPARNEGMFFRIQSWSEESSPKGRKGWKSLPPHAEIQNFIGHKVQISIETLD